MNEKPIAESRTEIIERTITREIRMLELEKWALLGHDEIQACLARKEADASRCERISALETV